MRASLVLVSLGAILVAGGCAHPKASFVIRDPQTASEVKKVAVMPFFDAQFQSSYDPLYKGSGSSFVPALRFDVLAKKDLSPRFMDIKDLSPDVV